MWYYVPIRRLSGRNDYLRLASLLDQLCIHAEYDPGGWHNSKVGRIVPHLRFESAEDATVFALYNGSTVSLSIPIE